MKCRLMFTVRIISARAERDEEKRHFHMLVRNSPMQYWCAFAPSVNIGTGVDGLLCSIDIAYKFLAK